MSIPLENRAEIRFEDFEAPSTERRRPTSPSSFELRRRKVAVEVVEADRFVGAREEVRG